MVAQDRIDEDSDLNPALLQAILSDPVLLQAVDPQVLQVVLVNAAAANLVIEDTPEKQSSKPTPVPVFTSEIEHTGPIKFGKPFNGVQKQKQQQHKPDPHHSNGPPRLGKAFSDKAKQRPGLPTFSVGQTKPENTLARNFNNIQHNSQRGKQNEFSTKQHKFGAPFAGFQASNSGGSPPTPTQIEFFDQPKENKDTSETDLDNEFTAEVFDKLLSDNLNNKQNSGQGQLQNKFLPKQQKFGKPFSLHFKPSEQIEIFNHPEENLDINKADHTNEFTTEGLEFEKLILAQPKNAQDTKENQVSDKLFIGPINKPLIALSQQLKVPPVRKAPTKQPSELVNQEIIEKLKENPQIVQELFQQLQEDPSMQEIFQQLKTNPGIKTHEKLELPPQAAPPIGPLGVCSLLTANGIPCDPGLAYSPVTGSCEWPDNLIEHGCNPEGRPPQCLNIYH